MAVAISYTLNGEEIEAFAPVNPSAHLNPLELNENRLSNPIQKSMKKKLQDMSYLNLDYILCGQESVTVPILLIVISKINVSR